MSLNRAPVQIVEIDIDYCTETYGSSPCTAALAAGAPNKCFNTYFTCQDTANFDKGTLTLRFAMNQNGLPKGTLIYPALTSVSTNPAKINLGGIDAKTGPLGKRARVNVGLQDFADNDTQTDKYQAGRVDGTALFSGSGYDPQSLGTFFGKLRRRYPYYIGRALRVLDGYEGEALASMRTRHYVISEWIGPDAGGRVSIVAKDVLDLADNEKAMCPQPSVGTLARDISATEADAFDLVPAGVGADYAASGRASIGSEVISFTRSTDTITITGRALAGTEAKAHSADDLFQQCFHVDGVAIGDVAADLLENYAGVDASFIPTADWDDEALWLAGFNLTTTIAKPTGVANLMGELAEHGVFWWWDDVAQEIKMRANRPIHYTETLLELNDSENIVEGSLSVADLHKQRLTQVIFWHGQIDVTGSATNGENYRRAHVSANDGGSTNEYNQDRILEIYSRWLGDGNDAVAAATANRLAVRFSDTPVQIEFQIDAKDRATVGVADLVEITTRAMQNELGQSLATEMQITAIDEFKPGHALRVTAQSHQFTGRYGYITENARLDYDASTADQRNEGTYIVDGTSPTFSDGTGPYLIF
jgi:hypothetical protein